ncbi:hypothetical protein [Mucilaginibacter gynuensis]
MPEADRPVILGATLRNKSDNVQTFEWLKNYEYSRAVSSLPELSTDRTVTFGFQNKINYKVIANWELAAHKSQGATQMTMSKGDLEEFWYFKLNGPKGRLPAAKLFDKLKEPWLEN